MCVCIQARTARVTEHVSLHKESMLLFLADLLSGYVCHTRADAVQNSSHAEQDARCQTQSINQMSDDRKIIIIIHEQAVQPLLPDRHGTHVIVGKGGG